MLNPAKIPQQFPALFIWCDGGSRGNPGPGACAFIVKNKKGNIIHQEAKFLGQTTNNLAEYQAVLLALNWLKENCEIYNVYNFYLDSHLIVFQLNGLFKVKNPKIRELIFKIKILESEIKAPITYNLIPRERNWLADLLVNQALNKNSLKPRKCAPLR